MKRRRWGITFLFLTVHDAKCIHYFSLQGDREVERPACAAVCQLFIVDVGQ